PGRSTKRSGGASCGSMRKKTSPRVRPGVRDVRARPCRPTSVLITDDLPTLERPAKAISGGPSGGPLSGPTARASNSPRLTTTGTRCMVAPMSRRRVIGLTGNIGSGKTTVARMLGQLGADVIDADQVARDVVKPGLPAFQEIVEEFGREVLAQDGTIDRK